MTFPLPVRSLALAPTLLTLAAATAGAQATVWVVDDDGGPGVDFTLLQDAIDTAADGDVLLVLDGVYGPRPSFPPAPTTIRGKGLTLAAEVGTEPVIAPLAVEDVPAGSVVTLRGFTSNATLVVEDCDGIVWLEDCDVVPSSFVGAPDALVVRDCAAVHAARCTFRAGSQLLLEPAGIRATRSTLHLYDSEATGADGYGATSNGGDGLRLTDGFLFASGSTLSGGDNGCAGDGLHLDGTAPSAITLGCAYAPGLDGDCASGDPGQGIRVDAGTFDGLPGTARRFVASSPVRAGGAVTLAYQGRPGDLVLGMYATTTSPVFVASLRGTLLVPSATLQLELLGPAGPDGSLSADVPVPGVLGEGSTLTLQTAALVPGAGWTLSGGSALLVLAP